jgi:hypothetical protein
MNDILAAAQEFAETQSSLLVSLDQVYPFLAFSDLDRVPKEGVLAILGKEWTFRRHGAGIKFTSSDGVIVDAHRAVTVVNGIDAWRLARYLSSIKKFDVSHRDLEKTFSELSKTGDLHLSGKSEEVYELSTTK